MREKRYIIRALVLELGVALCLAQLFCSHKEETVLYDLCNLRELASLKEQTLWINFGDPRFNMNLIKNWGYYETLPDGRTIVWGLEGGSTLSFDLLFLQDLAITMLCKAVPYEGAPSQSLKVIVNDQHLISFNLTSSFREYLFNVPSALLRQGVNYLQFVPKYSIAPQMNSEGSENEMKLSFCLDYILLIPKEWQEKGFHLDLYSIFLDKHIIPEEKRESPESQLWVPGLWERRYYLKIPPYSLLKYSFGFATAEWNSISPFKIDITAREEEGKERLLGSVTFDPEALKSLQRPAEGTIDLSPYWDKAVKLTLRFSPDETSRFNPNFFIYFHPRIIKDTGEAKRDDAQQRLARESERMLRDIRRDCVGANVLIFILDAAQASHFSCYGYHRKTTPFIDEVAKEGIVFQNGYCQAVYTLASTASLMTGWYPDAHCVLHRGTKLSDNALTMSEVFQKSGYHTASFTAMAFSSSAFGFRQGFDYFYESFKKKAFKNRADDFLPALFPWLEEHRSDPFFLYIHFREPHSIIDPPPPFTDMFDKDYQGVIDLYKHMEKMILSGEIELTPRDLYHIIATYDASICYADSVIGKIIDKLKSSGLYDRTVIIILADHGEALWEHGIFGHNTCLYEEVSRIPFIIKPPTSTGIGSEKTEALVQTIDLFPTLVDLLQLSVNNTILQGKSLLPLMAGRKSSVNDLLYFRSTKPSYGVRNSVYKYILCPATGEEELYNIRDDPQEKNNLMGSNEVIEIENYFRQQLSIWLQQQRVVRWWFFRAGGELPEIDEATLKNLKALGYITN